MTLRHVDSMALYSNDTEALASKWTAVNGSNSYRAAGRNTGAYGIHVTWAGAYFQRDFSSESWVGSNVGWVFGIAIKPDLQAGGAGSESQILSLIDKNVNTSGIFLTWSSTSTLNLKIGNGTSGAGLTAAVATSTCSTSTWDYHEFKVLPGGTNGAASRVIWKKNGVQVYDSGAGAIDLKSGTMNKLSLGSYDGNASTAPDNNAQCYFTDLYLCDTTGSNADFLGDTRIECLLPTGDGHAQDFTAGAPRNLCTPDQYGMEGSMAYTADTASPYSSGGTISQSTDIAYSGTHSLKVACTGGVFAPGASTLIPVKPSTTYTIAWRAQCSGVASLGAYITVNNLDATQTLIGAASISPYFPTYNNSSWTSDSQTFTTTSTTHYIQLEFGVNGSTNGRNIYFDEVGAYEGSTAYYKPPGAWGNVSELVEDGNATYLRSGVDGAIHTFQVGDLASVSGSVVGVVVNPWARAENTGTRQLQPVFEGAGSTAASAYVSGSALTQIGDTTWQSSATTTRITLPSNILEGDELFVLGIHGGTLTTGPAGFTQLDSVASGTAATIRLWHKVALSTDANSTISLVQSPSSQNNLLFFAYRGGTYNTFSKTTATSASTVNTPSVTPSAASQLVQLVANDAGNTGGANGSISTSWPLTTRSTLSGGFISNYILGDEVVAAGVGGGGRTVSGSSGYNYFAYTISLTGVSYLVGTTASAGTLNNDLAYHLVPLIVESNPITSAAWTISDVNAIEAGVKLN